MKNVTITLEEDVALWARIRAAHENTSVSKLVGEMLKKEMQQARNYERAMNRYVSRKPKRLSKSGKYPDRESLHDRENLR
jgi:hypothetical protein